VPSVVPRWFASLADRFFASDHGLIRLRFALRAMLSVMLAVLLLSLARVPTTPLLFGAICAMSCSTSMRTGSTRERGVHILLYAPVMGAALTVATLLSPYPIVADAVFVAVLFAAVYAQRFGQFGAGLGTGGFMTYFFALFLRSTPAGLPLMYLAVVVGLACCAVMALLVFRETPASTLRRTTLSIRAQVARLIEELATLLDDDARVTDGVPRSVARQATRMHESILQIEDSADLLDLDPQWQRQLMDAELSADRLARATVRALASNLDAEARADLAADLRGLHRFVDRNPEAALALDTDELMNRIARYDIRGDAGLHASDPAQHILLVHRAIRELLLAMVQIRRTTTRVLERPQPAPSAGSSRREPTLEDVEQGIEPDTDTEPDPATDTDTDTDTDDRTTAGSHPETSTVGSHELAYHTRAAIQAAIGGSLAIVGGTLLSGQRWYWAVIAGFIVFAGTHSRGDLLVKGWHRMVGTLFGIIAGTILATLLSGHPQVNLVLLLLCIFLAFYTLRVSYSTMTFFITVMLGMLYDILGEFTPDLLLLRLAETAIGVSSSMVAATLVLPTRTRSTVLTTLHDYFTALHTELIDAERLLVEADRVSVIAATRDVDRAANEVRVAIAPMLYRLSPSRVRRGHAIRLLTLTEESALAARNLARAAEPGALLHLPEAVDTLHRLIDNTEVLLAATQSSPKTAQLVSGPALVPTVDVRALIEAHNGGGEPDRLQVLHLRRTINCLDRLDKLLLGMAAPLAQTISIPTGGAHRPASR
jgi:uncharacterized membrane protein YccC